MNERIKELAEQANLWSILDSYSWEFGNYDAEKDCGEALEKFTRLIAEECIQFRTELTQFDNTTPYGDGYENGLNDMAELIAEHFGVE